MTTSHYAKAFTQLNAKPFKAKKFEKHNSPKDRPCGIGRKKCARCGRTGGHIDKYGINLCRQCFRDIATEIGFKKYA